MRSPSAKSITITIANRFDSNGDKISVESPSTESILETLEREQVDIQYHCRDGFCGACRSKLISGEVSYTTDPLAFIDDDEFLPCCTKPQSPIVIEVE